MAEIKSKPSAATFEDIPNLKGETLTLMEIINIARRADPGIKFKMPDLPDPWDIRFRDLRQRVVLGEIPRIYMPSMSKLTTVSLRDLAPFAEMQDDNWEWLRKFCRRWARARGEDLQTQVTDASPAGETQSIFRQNTEHWYRQYCGEQERLIAAGKKKKHPSIDDDIDAATSVFPNITRERVRELRRDIAPNPWKKKGRRPQK